MKLNYSTYLKLPALLSLQNDDDCVDSNNELLFITVHQAEELYFKVLLSELKRICSDFTKKNVFAAISRFERCTSVLVSLAGQLSILESLSPMQFFKFRDRLGTASGFQSCQFRGLMFILGQKKRELVAAYENAEEHDWLIKKLHDPTLVDYFYQFLHLSDGSIPTSLLKRDYTLPIEPNESVQNSAKHLCLTHPKINLLFERILDFDSALQQWRYKHYKLVERSIGTLSGTGGSSGVDFLRESIFKNLFIDLWAIRGALSTSMPSTVFCPMG